MHRTFLDILKHDLDKLGVLDINNVQAMLIYNISRQQVSVGELISRGMYNGSNVSYNIKRLVEAGYLLQIPSERDKRSLFVKLSDKGFDIYTKIDECIRKHVEKLDTVFQNKKTLDNVYKGLVGLESFWNQSIFWL
jgi:DNA-binding MarR family transcriptional regulator